MASDSPLAFAMFALAAASAWSPKFGDIYFIPGYYYLAVVDVRMPSLNGFELYSEIRSIDYKIKVLFLSALTDLHDYDDFKSDVSPRLHQIVQKPVEKEQFLDQVYFILFWTRLIFYVIDKRIYHSNDYIFFMILLDTLYFLVPALSGFVKGLIGGRSAYFWE